MDGLKDFTFKSNLDSAAGPYFSLGKKLMEELSRLFKGKKIKFIATVCSLLTNIRRKHDLIIMG